MQWLAHGRCAAQPYLSTATPCHRVLAVFCCFLGGGGGAVLLVPTASPHAVEVVVGGKKDDSIGFMRRVGWGGGGHHAHYPCVIPTRLVASVRRAVGFASAGVRQGGGLACLPFGRDVGWRVPKCGDHEPRIFCLPLVLFFAPHRH